MRREDSGGIWAVVLVAKNRRQESRSEISVLIVADSAKETLDIHRTSTWLLDIHCYYNNEELVFAFEVGEIQ